MATFRKGKANQPTARSPKAEADRQAKIKRSRQDAFMDHVCQTRSADDHNVRGLAATGSNTGSAIANTRPDLYVPGKLDRAAAA